MVSWPKWTGGAKHEERRPAERRPTISVRFTPEALARAKEVLAAQRFGDGGALRLWVEDPGPNAKEYRIGLAESRTPQAGDTVVDVAGLCVLVDEPSVPHVAGARVSFVDDPLRAGFQIDPPPPPSELMMPMAMPPGVSPAQRPGGQG